MHFSLSSRSGKLTPSRETPSPNAVDVASPLLLRTSKRTVTDNLSGGRSLQVNAPIGEDGWREVDDLTIQKNVTNQSAAQFNHAISGLTFDKIMSSRQQTTVATAISSGPNTDPSMLAANVTTLAAKAEMAARSAAAQANVARSTVDAFAVEKAAQAAAEFAAKAKAASDDAENEAEELRELAAQAEAQAKMIKFLADSAEERVLAAQAAAMKAAASKDAALKYANQGGN